MMAAALFSAVLVALMASAAGVAGSRDLLQGCTTLDAPFTNLIRTGDTVVGTNEFGLGMHIDEKYQRIHVTISEEARRKILEKGELEVASTQPDYTSLLTAPDGKLYVVTQFEAPAPSSVYMIGVDQDKETGKLTPISLQPIDFSEYGGVWVTCSGMKTPWGTHLGGEEYEPNARLIYEAQDFEEDLDDYFQEYLSDFTRFFENYDASPNMDELKKDFKPYMYGYAFEVKPLAGGKYEATKWFLTGRGSKELSWVMDDNKTIYHTDDGTNVALFKTVLDNPADKSSGCIEVAKFIQTDDKNGGTFDIEWIPLACSTDEYLREAANSTDFGDIFTTADPNEDGTCPAGFKPVNQGGVGFECLNLVEGAEVLAAFFETRRYGGYMGATTEFSKWEGITYSKSRKQMFTAMSEIRRGMEDNKSKGKDETKYDIGTSNDIKLEYNPCGCVYVMDVDDDMSATKMYALTCGYLNTDETDENNVCDLKSIANPDGIGLMEDFDILFIAEDATDAHQNDVAWAYNLNDGTMTRISSTPYGAEFTSPYFFPGINGFSYVMAVAQHPYMESDEDKNNLVNNTDFEGMEGYINYWVFPDSAIEGKTIKFLEVEPALDNKAKSTFYGSDGLEICPKVPSGPTFLTPAFESAKVEESPATVSSPAVVTPSVSPAVATPAPPPKSAGNVPVVSVTAALVAMFTALLA